jgi:hypothetical protein
MREGEGKSQPEGKQQVHANTSIYNRYPYDSALEARVAMELDWLPECQRDQRMGAPVSESRFEVSTATSSPATRLIFGFATRMITWSSSRRRASKRWNTSCKEADREAMASRPSGPYLPASQVRLRKSGTPNALRPTAPFNLSLHPAQWPGQLRKSIDQVHSDRPLF